MDHNIALADAVAALRQQLAEAQERANDQDIRFDIGPIEMEFTVVVTREASAAGKIGFAIFTGLEVSAGGKLGDTQTHKLKLSLTPRAKGGQDLRISGRK